MKKNYNGQLNINLEPGQAAVVLDKSFWDHMVQWYTIMANESVDPTEKANWVSVIDEVEYWVKHTHYDASRVTAVVDDDDEWG